MIERRKSFVMDEEKFTTQKIVSYAILGIFAGVTIAVLWRSDQAERTTIVQTVINLTLMAVGYWIGASKSSADARDAMTSVMKPQAESMARMAEAAAPAAVPAVTPALMNPATGAVPAAEVAEQPPKGTP